MSAKPKKRKRRFTGRLIIFLTLLAIVCIILFLTNFLGFASLRRLSYRIFDGVNGNGTEETIKFSENQSNLYAFTDGSLSVISPDILSVYELSGSTTFSSQVLLRNPAISTNDSTLLAFDLGGLNYYVADEDEILLSKTTDSKILNANLNSSGGFTIITDSPDCKSLVTAFDSDYKTIYKFHSSQEYVFDAALAPDEETLAIINYGITEGVFESSFSLCRTNEQSFFSKTSLDTSIPLKVDYISDDRISVICDDKLLLFSDFGKLISEIPYDNALLKNFSTSCGLAAVLLSDSNVSGETKLLVLTADGKSSSLVINDEVYHLSTAEDYIAILYDAKCVVYDKNLSKHCEVETSSKISKCLANDDGSVLLLSDNSAIFFVK